ncbi:MAG: aquaporin family protein [Balneolaceae bacterium]|nr:aquaporin family protein [Balneolaceae bacterium]
MQKYIMEALGTFFLVLVYGFTGNEIAVGLILSALMYVGAHISGAHFNPAVSLAFYFNGKISFKQLFGYFSSQIIAAFLAAIVIYYFTSSVFYVEPPYDTNIYQQAGAELSLTFIFVWVVLAFMTLPRYRNNPMFGIIIGLTFSGILITGTKISGGVFNPAISLGPALFDLLMQGNSIYYSLLYTLAPFAGGALAIVAFNYFEKEKAVA